jgi:osmotically-inducible protein OsmY
LPVTPDQIALKAKLKSTAVKSDVEAALKRRAGDEAHGIEVAVQGSEVTLSGTVQTWSERELVRHSAWDTPGVRSVVDGLTVAN